jgi:hypothetical protein
MISEISVLRNTPLFIFAERVFPEMPSCAARLVCVYPADVIAPRNLFASIIDFSPFVSFDDTNISYILYRVKIFFEILQKFVASCDIL